MTTSERIVVSWCPSAFPSESTRSSSAARKAMRRWRRARFDRWRRLHLIRTVPAMGVLICLVLATIYV